MLPLLAGCGGGGGGGGTTVVTGVPASLSATAPNGLVATITENTNIISPGGNVTYTYKLTNPTGAAITIASSSTAPTTPDVVVGVTNSAGTLVYASLPPSPSLSNATLGPGQSLTNTETVAAFASAGVYNATAKFGNIPPVLSVGPLVLTVQ